MHLGNRELFSIHLGYVENLIFYKASFYHISW